MPTEVEYGAGRVRSAAGEPAAPGRVRAAGAALAGSPPASALITAPTSNDKRAQRSDSNAPKPASR